MDGGSQICDGPTSRQPAGQPNLEKMAAGRGPPGGPGRHFFQIWLAAWLAAGWSITYLAPPIRFGGILCILYIIQCLLYII